MPPQSQQLIQNGGKYRKSGTVAEVIPMVKGHNIHKPKVRITRLNMNDLNNLVVRSRQVQARQDQEPGDAQELNQDDHADEGEDEQLVVIVKKNISISPNFTRSG
jgi:hypothetical protein